MQFFSSVFDDMRSLITSADIAVSAAGSTLYEICACGVPLVTYIIADNQIKGAEAFEKLGLAVNCGDIRKITNPVGKIMTAVKNLADDYQLRHKTGENMQQIIDGHGADRIARNILIYLP